MSNRHTNQLGRPVSFSSEDWGFESGGGNKKAPLEESPDLSRFYTAKEEFGANTLREADEYEEQEEEVAVDDEYEGAPEWEYSPEDYDEYADKNIGEGEEEEEVEEEEEAEDEVDVEEAEDVQPSYAACTKEEIDAKVVVRNTPGKGRCLYAKQDLKPGDVIFVEKPVMVAIPSADAGLWQQLTALHEESPMELPPIWHLAALVSLTKLSPREMTIIGDKWVPDRNKVPSDDVIRVLHHTGLPVNANRYERFLQAWRFNSFGHHTESDGLVLYDRISMMAHDCNSSSCWHYGEGDSFVLRSRQYISAGEELTISYIGDEDLFKSAPVRREKLAGWQFTCHCERCDATTDITRGFRCPECGSGVIFLTTDEDSGQTMSSICTVCRREMAEDKIEQYLEFERAYIERLDETGNDDLNDAELVLCEAQRVFIQHWTLFALHTTLFEGRKEEGSLEEAMYHQQKRIDFVSAVLPKATYTLAWLYEELGDLMSSRINPYLYDENAEETPTLTNHQKNTLSRIYEDGMNLLLILCGDHHEYTLAIFKRLEKINEMKTAPR